MAATALQIYFRFPFWWRITIKNVNIYLSTKFRQRSSIRGRDITISAFWKQTAAILKVYFPFPRKQLPREIRKKSENAWRQIRCVCLSVGCWCGFYRYIKMSSPNMNNIILTGCMLAYSSVFLLGLDGRLVSQQVFPLVCSVNMSACLSIGFTFSSFFWLKSWRTVLGGSICTRKDQVNQEQTGEAQSTVKRATYLGKTRQTIMLSGCVARASTCQ